jgi:hypothetical protein
MSNDSADDQRRTVLQISAGRAAAGPLAMNAAIAAAIPPAPTGKSGYFDFLSGQWKIKNRQLKKGVRDQFDSDATVFGILCGIASVEELRIPARSFSGMGLRLLDLECKVWADCWVSAPKSKSSSRRRYAPKC